MNMGGTLASYWWVLGFQKAVLHTDTTDWCVLGQWRVTATMSASTWSTYTWWGRCVEVTLGQHDFWLVISGKCSKETQLACCIRDRDINVMAMLLSVLESKPWREGEMTFKVWADVCFALCSYSTLELFTCMNPCAASSWCSLLRATFPAMIPLWNPTSPAEVGEAEGFHLG